jgi:Putative sensor
VWSIVAFTILVTGVSVTAPLLVLVIGVFVWVGFAYIVRWATWVDRRLAGWQRNERLRAVYRRPTARGFLPLLKTVSSDPQTWRDLAWLGLTSIAGFALGLAAITAAGIVLAYVSMPVSYWAISDPHAQYGVTNLGVFTVYSPREAFAATAIGLALAPLALLLARDCATAHAGLAVRILSPATGAELRVEPRSISLARAEGHVGGGRRHAGDVHGPRCPMERRASAHGGAGVACVRVRRLCDWERGGHGDAQVRGPGGG